MFNYRKKIDLSPRLKFGVGRKNYKNQIFKISAIFCLLLTAVLTINAVRLVLLNKGSETAPSKIPAVLGASDSRIQTQTPSSIGFSEYKIQKGDTLFNISQRLNLDWTTLASLNNIKSPYTLRVGQTIKIPK